MAQSERLNLYTSVVPNDRQLKIQQIKYYAFVHYTVNTFTGKEWGSGRESEAVFNPKKQDTDQWCRAFKAAGMKGVVLTCKHHDGFCLWQTKTTEHCIRNSPYKNGKGDVVRELSQSCKKYGLKFGVYLSPWDRNSALYGTDAYNDFYIAQLTELLTHYGEIFMLWLDGACGADSDGKPKQKYDFERIWKTAVELQPNIVSSVCSPDVRWVGNENGLARESEWNVVPKVPYWLENPQKDGIGTKSPDLGSREILQKFNDFMWYPAEVDVSIRPGWFYHASQTPRVKSLKRLMQIYYGSVGSNCLLILNVPPNKNGLISSHDVRRLKQVGKWLKKEDDNVIGSRWELSKDKTEINVTFQKQSVDRVRLSEDTTKSQRIESFKIYANGSCVYSGTVVGFSKIAIFTKPVVTDSLTIKITSCRNEPYIEKIEVVKTGAYRVK